MKTSIVNVYGKKNFVMDTEIPKVSYRPGITNLTVCDDKGNMQFALAIDIGKASGSISDFGITCNGVNAAGNLVVLIPICEDTTVDDLKAIYGSKIVKAAGYLGTLKSQMATEAEAVDAIFEGVAEAVTFDGEGAAEVVQ